MKVFDLKCRRVSFQGRLRKVIFSFQEGGKPKDETSVSFILKKAWKLSFILKAESFKDNSLEASSILKKARRRLGSHLFIFEENRKPEDESLKASASFILKKTRRVIFSF